MNDGDEVFRLLVVCTANQCRSPMGEALARHLLESRLVDCEVASAGIMPGGVAASRGTITVMRRRGLDVSAHRSHQLDRDTVQAADLIITMERGHIAAVAELSLAAVERSFTLVELADLASVTGPRTGGVGVGDWIAAANRMRHPTSVMAVGAADDVQDPMGGPARAYRRTADQIDALLTTVVDAMFPLPESTASS